MESEVILSAEDKGQLNALIDEKLKQGYLIVDQMYECDQGKICQLMRIPRNIDSEVNLKGIIKLVAFIAFMIAINMMIL